MTSLYVDRRGIELETDGEALVFRENGMRIGTVPLAPLTRVFLRGDVRLQTSLLGKLGARGIGVVIVSGRKAEATLMMGRLHNDAARRIAQYRNSLDPGFCLRFARDIVRAKIESQYRFTEAHRQTEFGHRYELGLVLRKLDAAMARVEDAQNIPSLRGIEGTASAAHFQGLSAIAPPRLGFHQRNRRPPRDPFNAVLSLGYTLLHAEAVLAIHGAGLDPYIGFYHQLDYGRESLACDLVEPLRIEVENLALESFRKNILRPEDFSNSEAGCLLTKSARPRFYEAWEAASEHLRKALAEHIGEIIARLQVDPTPSPPTPDF